MTFRQNNQGRQEGGGNSLSWPDHSVYSDGKKTQYNNKKRSGHAKL